MTISDGAPRSGAPAKSTGPALPLRSAIAAELALREVESGQRGFTAARARFWLTLLLIVAFYVVSWQLAHVDLPRLAIGMPKLLGWVAQAWPPDVAELPIFAFRTAETVAMALIGTTMATILALPMAIFASRNITPIPALYLPARWFLNALRGVDSFVFALLFVAAVGLGPFAGVLGIGLHTWGSMAKLYADQIENASIGPLEAVEATGAPWLPAILFALLPDVLPLLVSTTLFWWEFNVRASTVLGIVGAGGIGQELKNSMDLLDFSRLFTIIAVILVVVTALDQLSGWLRRRMV